MRSAILILLGFLLLVVQSTFALMAPLDMFVPSLSLPIVLYMGLHHDDMAKGAIRAFGIGYLNDVFAGSPMGLYTLVMVAIFMVSRVAALRLFLQGWIFEIALTFFLAVLSSLFILGIRALFDQDIGGLLIHLKIVMSRAVATAIVAPAIFRMTARIEKMVPKRRGTEGRILRG